MNLLLFGGTMPEALRTQIVARGDEPRHPAPVLPAGSAGQQPRAHRAPPTPTNQAQIDAAKRDRVYLAVFLSMASPDYLIQK